MDSDSLSKSNMYLIKYYLKSANIIGRPKFNM